MRKLNVVGVNVDNSDPTNYPWGKLKNKITGVQSGTILSEEVLGDLIQAMYEVLRVAGIEPDGDAEKKEASQFADAVALLGIRPVAVIRAGWHGDDEEIKVLGGVYADGYSADFVETSVSGDTAVLCKLTINKDGVASTENYFVEASSAYGLAAPIIGCDHGYDLTGGAWEGIYFKNDDDGNVIVGDPDSGAIADLRVRTQLIIKVYKAD